MNKVTVVGGGLAGCEIALQLSSRNFDVDLIEMRPVKSTPAHRTSDLAELVCSNSLKSDNPETASGLLKRELRMNGCILLQAAEKSKVPAGHALAVDREIFAATVTGMIESDPKIRITREEVTGIDLPAPAVIATGPLTSDALSSSIKEHFSEENLFFYDAISISLSLESLDMSGIFKGSRYGKGEPDYWNVPLSRGQYSRIIEHLKDAPKRDRHNFEEKSCFDACLPVEVIASRGVDSLRFGPLKPKGLPDPATGKEPYAVLQLRQETLDGSMVGMVGFQTRMTADGQRELLKLLPGLENAEILRYGTIHRNTYISSPDLLDGGQMSRSREGLFFSGQITGVEGYMESIAHGLIAARNLADFIEGKEFTRYPPDTMLGGLQAHLSEKGNDFQPMNANFGLLPPAHGTRRERKIRKVERAVDSMKRYLASI